MSRPIITLGCRTSHGGTVVSASQLSDIHGKAIARVGDRVSCPRCSGNLIIVSGDVSMIVDGAAVARDGDKTSCGAMLIADQHTTFILETGIDAFFSSSAGSASTTSGNPHTRTNSMFNEFFQLLHAESGLPIRLTEYAIVRESGDIEHGTTDDNGHTHLLSSTANSESVDIYV